MHRPFRMSNHESIAQSLRPPGRIAGIDFGTVRLGIALSDPWRKLASPIASYTRGNLTQDEKYLKALALQESVALFVVGLPVHLDGRESQKSQEARQFGGWLGGVTGVPVEFFDERFTTSQAQAALAEAHFTSKRRRKRVDMVAAQMILAAYLESGSGGQQTPGPLDD